MLFSNNKRIIPIIVSLLIFFFGCERGFKKTEPKDQQVLAKVNNYEMTVADFKDEVALTQGSKSLPSDPMKAKEQLLEELINKQILIQEAQKLNFDKEKSFMKDIERYWEQALLKLLLNKKSEELSRTIEVTDTEVQREYDRMVLEEEDIEIEPFEKIAPQIRKDLVDRKAREALEKWIEDVEKKAKVKIDQKILQEIELE